MRNTDSDRSLTRQIRFESWQEANETSQHRPLISHFKRFETRQRKKHPAIDDV